MTSKRHFAIMGAAIFVWPPLLRAQFTTELEALTSIDGRLDDVENKIDTLIVYASDGNIQNANNLQSIYMAIIFCALCLFLFTLIYRAVLER